MVTVVITTCKREAKIVFRAIESVLSQTYKDWELIVVDDSSCDYKQRNLINNKCSELSKFYNVSYIANKENSGACFSRNEGLQVAKGEYIAYLDDDDEWLTDKLEKQVQCLDNASDEVALVYGPLYKENDETGERQKENLPLYSGFLYDKLMERGNFVGGMSIPMMRTKCVKAVGGFDMLMQSAQDQDLWLRLSDKYQFTSISDILIVCHTHKGDQISKDPQKKIAGMKRLIEKNKEYLEEHSELMWKKTLALIPYYLLAGQKKEALATWRQAVALCPKKIPTNAKELIRIVGNKSKQ